MNKKIKKRLIILSDLWGKEKSDWIAHYTITLEKHFEVKFYDCCVLGEIDKSVYTQEALHLQFINGGIEKAVSTILKKEKGDVIVLGFSIGGYVAWKACNSGLKSQCIFALSSTRLRFETQKPSCIIKLFYGEDEANKPENSWFEKLEIDMNFYKHEGHELYKKKEIAEKICKMIIKLK